MANLPRVNPGDLITAAFLNALVDEVEDLGRQLKELRAAGTVVTSKVWISEFRPQRAVRLGAEVEVVGGGFGARSTTTVRVGNRIIDRFSVFEDGRLVFKIPTELGPITGLANVDFSIENRSTGTRAQLAIVLLPEEDLPWGQFFFETIAPGGKLGPGGHGDFVYTVTITGTSDQTFKVLPVLTPATVGTAEYVTAGGARIQPPEALIRPGRPTELRIRLTLAANAPNGQDGRLALRLECTKNSGFADTSTETPFKVGGTAQAEGPLKVNFVKATPPTGAGVDADGRSIFKVTPKAETLALVFDAIITAAQAGDHFNIDVGTGAATDPAAALDPPPAELAFVIDDLNDPATSPRHYETGTVSAETHRTVYVNVSATAAASADLVVRVTRKSNPAEVWGLFRRTVVAG